MKASHRRLRLPLLCLLLATWGLFFARLGGLLRAPAAPPAVASPAPLPTHPPPGVPRLRLPPPDGGYPDPFFGQDAPDAVPQQRRAGTSSGAEPETLAVIGFVGSTALLATPDGEVHAVRPGGRLGPWRVGAVTRSAAVVQPIHP